MDFLEARRVLSGLINGDFGISDPGDPGFGYTLRGGAAVSGGEGVLTEGGPTQPGISQSFTIAPGATALRFSIVAADLAANGNLDPLDAFEVALLDATSGLPLVGPPTNLPNTDSLLNLQQNGEVYHAPGVTIPGAGASGQVVSLAYPVVVTVDLAGVAPGAEALLSFDLIGFGPAASSVRIDDLILLNANGPPLLTLNLDPARDSGALGDDLTRHNPIHLVGNTDPNQAVSLDVDGDGFDDGSATADATGLFRFDTITMSEGTTTLRAQATSAGGETVATRSVTLDTQSPTGALASPTPGSTITQDPGFIEIAWTDPGAAGLLESSFGPDDVTISGVDVDSAEPLGGGRVRYHYNADGDTLPIGTINVTLPAGQVLDRAGNPSAPGAASFVRADDVQPPPPPPPPPPVPSGPIMTRLRRYGYHRQPTSLMLNFDRDLAPASARDVGHYVLTGAGRDGRFGTRDDRRIKIRSALYDAAARAVVLSPARRLSVFHPYQLRLIGAGPTGITDTAGNLLDGDGDGRAGGDLITRFDRRHLAGRAADLPDTLRQHRRDV